jgi:hypothetical protein
MLFLPQGLLVQTIGTHPGDLARAKAGGQDQRNLLCCRAASGTQRFEADIGIGAIRANRNALPRRQRRVEQAFHLAGIRLPPVSPNGRLGVAGQFALAALPEAISRVSSNMALASSSIGVPFQIGPGVDVHLRDSSSYRRVVFMILMVGT